MILLIDGFNAIYKFPELEENMYRGELVEAMRGLLELLFRLRKASRKAPTVHVFFDGKRKRGDETRRETVSDMHVYYSIDMSADHLIKEFIKKAPSPGEIQVVSSDKDVSTFARKHRCKTKTSEEFAEYLLEEIKPKTKQKPEKDTNPNLSAGEVNYWMEMFKKDRD